MNVMWQMWIKRFSQEWCKKIIDSALQLPISPANIGIAGEDTRIRRSKLRWIFPNTELFNFLQPELEDLFYTANQNAFGLDLWRFTEIQFTEYDENIFGTYDWHNDVLWHINKPSQRKLSLVIQLTDPNEYFGGDLEIEPLYLEPPAVNELRTQGTAIVFPSILKHRIAPVSKGKRHSLVAWIEGPKWK